MLKVGWPLCIIELTPDEAGLRLGVFAKVLEYWRSHAQGPAFVCLSRKVIRYRAQDVDDFVAGRVMPVRRPLELTPTLT
jgi:hypothetical protein